MKRIIAFILFLLVLCTLVSGLKSVMGKRDHRFIAKPKPLLRNSSHHALRARAKPTPKLDSKFANHKFLFVGGLQRSGTTPLSNAFASLPDFSGMGDVPPRPGSLAARVRSWPKKEGKFIQNVIWYAPEGVPFKPTGRQCVSPLNSKGTWAEQRPRANSFGDSLTAKSVMLFEQWSAAWNMSSTWLVEKSPEDLLLFPVLDALLKPAHFILLMRHPAIDALAQSKWTAKFPYTRVVENWLRCNDYALADAMQLAARAANVRIVYYEHFANADDRLALFRALVEWLGVEWPRHIDRKLLAKLPNGDNAKYARALRMRDTLGRFENELDEAIEERRKHLGPATGKTNVNPHGAKRKQLSAQLGHPYPAAGIDVFPLARADLDALTRQSPFDVAMRKFGYSMDDFDMPVGVDCRDKQFKAFCRILAVPKSQRRRFHLPKLVA
jgi:Sulfotransferase family